MLILFIAFDFFDDRGWPATTGTIQGVECKYRFTTLSDGLDQSKETSESPCSQGRLAGGLFTVRGWRVLLLLVGHAL